MASKSLTDDDFKKAKVNLVFHFTDVQLDVALEEGFFDEESEKEVMSLVDDLRKSIWIDQTYVGYDGSKYSDVFLTVEGWEALCAMLVLSNYGEHLHPKSQEQVVEAYQVMTVCYMLTELEKRGWSHEHIKIMPKDDANIEAEIYLDETPLDAWKNYRGPWQDWPENNY